MWLTIQKTKQNQKQNVWNASDRRQHYFITPTSELSKPYGAILSFHFVKKKKKSPFLQTYFHLIPQNWSSFHLFYTFFPFRDITFSISIWCCTSLFLHAISISLPNTLKLELSFWNHLTASPRHLPITPLKPSPCTKPSNQMLTKPTKEPPQVKATSCTYTAPHIKWKIVAPNTSPPPSLSSLASTLEMQQPWNPSHLTAASTSSGDELPRKPCLDQTHCQNTIHAPPVYPSRHCFSVPQPPPKSTMLLPSWHRCHAPSRHHTSTTPYLHNTLNLQTKPKLYAAISLHQTSPPSRKPPRHHLMLAAAATCPKPSPITTKPCCYACQTHQPSYTSHAPLIHASRPQVPL